MRQYTSPEQTAKLIELGLPRPKSVLLYAQSADCDNNYGWRGEVKYNCDYTIGELIEMLPPIIDEYSSTVVSGGGTWSVHYKRIFASRYDTFAKELIDALYDMVVKLKEEGVI